MCPAQFNSKAGKFSFLFSAYTSSIKSNVVTNNVEVKIVPPFGYREIYINNTGNKTYSIKVLVDGITKGTYTIKPYSSSSIYKDNKFTNSELSAFVMDSNGKALWNSTYGWKPTYTTSTSNFQNPTFFNFKFDAYSIPDGLKKSYSFTGIDRNIYDNIVNQQFTVGSAKFNVVDGTYMGINYNAGGKILGPNCKTFFGLKAFCSASCDASLGLQLTFGLGAGAAFGPASLGCVGKCGVKVASFDCQIATAEISASVIPK